MREQFSLPSRLMTGTVLVDLQGLPAMDTESRPMPGSVLLAIMALAILVLIAAVGMVGSIMNSGRVQITQPIAMGLGGLILIGMITGHRLAWQWGRVLGILAAILYTFIAIITVTD